jgi:lysophospholipase L1-like esterase
MSGLRVAMRAVAVAAGSIGGISGALYGLLHDQARRARTIIGRPFDTPFNADGVYLPSGTGPFPEPDRVAFSFAVLGDSLAAGLGADSPSHLPGVILAKGLAAELRFPVRLATHAISGSKTFDLHWQVDQALHDPPGLALVIIGGNDVTSKSSITASVTTLRNEVSRLMAAGTVVVVGTCPDLGTVAPIPQPLRAIASRFSKTLAKAQHRELVKIGATAVPIARMASPEFLIRPELFSQDRFHPNSAGYVLAANVLLPALCAVVEKAQGELGLAA